jgi:catechol 2,3-dioxygenase-like lactoylglutathione lyase family enzyme
MIRKISHITIYVLNQEEALQFYTKRLGFEVRMDVTMEGGFRWLTVGLKDQPDLEVVLMEPKAGPMWDEESVRMIRSLIEKGKMGTGVLETDDCRKTYEQLKGAGVEFIAPPEEKFYGIEALLKDNSGNWFSMTQHK